jgi:hypothetical protein
MSINHPNNNNILHDDNNNTKNAVENNLVAGAQRLYVNDNHKEFNCVCTCKVQVVEQCTSTILGVERDVVNMFDLPSSQSSADSPNLNRCNRAGGGKCKFE